VTRARGTENSPGIETWGTRPQRAIFIREGLTHVHTQEHKETHMPNCIQLFPLGQTEPATFARIDELMCADFGVECHPTRWFNYWYDVIGLKLAMGRTWDQIKEQLLTDYGPDDLWYRQACWLADRYTCNAWVEIGRPRS
jgi:hypothetical protein